jgi:hypothetical protein
MEDLKFIQLQSERVNDQFALQELKGTNPSFGYALAQKAGIPLYLPLYCRRNKMQEKQYT